MQNIPKPVVVYQTEIHERSFGLELPGIKVGRPGFQDVGKADC